MSEADHSPALSQLEQDFDLHIQEFRGGIPTSEDYVYWLQRLSVLTLGYLENDVLGDLFSDPVAFRAIVTGRPSASAFEDLDISTREHERLYRLRVENYLLTPTFQDAYSELKTRANEYVDETGKQPSTYQDLPFALRPSLNQLSRKQRDVLDKLFQDAGFDDREALSDWIRDLVAASRGHVPKKDIHAFSGRDDHVHDVLLNEDSHEEEVRRNFLEKVAAQFLLRYFNNAVRELGQTAAELSEDQGENQYGGALDV